MRDTPPRKGAEVADDNAANARTHAVGSAGKTDRRRILQAALASGPVILTLKAGPARAAMTSTHLSGDPHLSASGGTGFDDLDFTTSSIESPTSVGGGFTSGGSTSGGSTSGGSTTGGSTSGGTSSGYTTGGTTDTSTLDDPDEPCTTVVVRKWRMVRSEDGGGRDGDGVSYTRQSYEVTKTVCGGTTTSGRYRRRLSWARLHSMMGGERMGDGGE